MTKCHAGLAVKSAPVHGGRLALLFAALLVLPGVPAAEELGRLFFTPERRAALERQRQLNIQETQPVIEGATLSVSGVVRRSSGRNITWINGVPQEEGHPAAGVRVQLDRADPARATVVAGEEAPATLKVGEAVNRATGETTTGIGGGRISVRRPDARTK